MPAMNDVGASTPPPRRFRAPLNTVAAVRRELGRLYRQARARELPVSDASKLGNLLYLIGRLIGGEELEARIRRLEEEQADREPWRGR
jgi:hypothetical protein